MLVLVWAWVWGLCGCGVEVGGLGLPAPFPNILLYRPRPTVSVAGAAREVLMLGQSRMDSAIKVSLNDALFSNHALISKYQDNKKQFQRDTSR